MIMALFATASAAEAQNWNTPSSMGPRPGSDLGLSVVDGDLGADVLLSQSLKLRIGASFGDGDALGIGLAWQQ